MRENQTRKITKLFITLILFLEGTFAQADFDKTKWEFRTPVLTGTNQVSSFVSFDIPSSIFENLNADLSDLRISDTQGTEVPFVLETDNQIKGKEELPTKVENLSSIQGLSTSFIVDLGKSGSLHDSITIDTDSENFKRDVKIEGSDDQSSWSLLTGTGQIFDFTLNTSDDNIRSQLTILRYPVSTKRYLRVTIFDRGEIPLHITGAEVAIETNTPAKRVSYHTDVIPAGIDQSVMSSQNSTDIILDLGAAGIPHGEGEIQTTDSNFSRAIKILESADGKAWNVLGGGYVFSINTDAFSGKNLLFSYPESRKRYLKISILNGDNRPIKIAEVNIFGTVRSVIFNYESGKKYYVYSGNPNARNPEYDLSAISQYLTADKIGSVSLSATEHNPDFVATLPPLSERSPYLLPSFLIIIIIILGTILLKLFHQNKK